MKAPIIFSSWISQILYKRAPDGSSYLAVFLKRQDRNDSPTALLYGPNVSSYLPGLLSAGLGGKSVGRAFNKLVKGKVASGELGGYQRVEGREKVRELKRMMS